VLRGEVPKRLDANAVTALEALLAGARTG